MTPEKDPPTVRLGRRIARLRKRAGLTQEKLSEISGVSLPALRSYEAGKKKMRAIDVPAVAAALRTDVATLLGSRSELLDQPAQRQETVYFVRRDVERAIQQAERIEDLRAFWRKGLAFGFAVPPDAEEVSAEEFGRVHEAVREKVAKLKGIPRDW